MAEKIPTPNDYYLMNADATQGVNREGQIFNFAEPSAAALTGGPGPTPTPSPDNQVIQTDNRPQQTIDFEAQQIVACVRSGGRWVNGMCVRSPEETPDDDGDGPEEPVPGGDARMPFDQYMDSLQVNTLETQAYTDSLARRLAAIDEQQLAAGQSYQDMYEQAQMSQARRRGLSDVTGFAGGMQEQFGARMSAAEMASLGQIGMGREAAIRGIDMQRMNAPMDAFAEAQAVQEADRTRMLQGIEMQRSQTLFEQAQSGWRQDPETGEWTNIDKETQDMLSLQAINAQQRAETIGEMQYWQAILADPTQATMHEGARAALGELQTRYADLLLNNQAMTGGPAGTTTPEVDDGAGGPQPEPEPVPRTILGARTEVSTAMQGLEVTDQMAAQVGRTLLKDVGSVNDLATLVVELAGSKATDGNYNFEPELAIMNKVANGNVHELTEEQFEMISPYLKAGRDSRGMGLSSPMRQSTQNRAPGTFKPGELNTAFVDYALENGILNSKDVKILDDGSLEFVYRGLIADMEKEYNDFRDDYLSKKAPSTPASGFAAGSMDDLRARGIIR